VKQIHSLLRRQLRRHFGEQFSIPGEWRGFIGAVNDAYQEFDMDHGMLERSLELSSQELLQRNSELQTIFQAIPDLLLRLDSEGTILDYQAGGTTRFFLQPAELIGKRIQDVPLEYVGDIFRRAIHQVRETHSIVSIEYSLTTQGQQYSYEARLLPLLKDQIIVIIRNITERAQVEEALREGEARFRDVAFSMADWIWEVDGNGVYTYCSEKVEEILGYSREEIIGKTPFDLMLPEEAERIGKMFSRISATRTITWQDFGDIAKLWFQRADCQVMVPILQSKFSDSLFMSRIA